MSPPKSGRGGKPAKAKAAKPAKDAKGKAVKPAKVVKTAKAGAAARSRGVYVQSPKSDVYVTLLGISLGSLLLACLLLFLVYSKYDMKTTPTARLDAGTLAPASLEAVPSQALWA